MLTEKDYCSFETCVALKELGFPIDWFEDETYHENNTEISLYEAQKFLREEKQIEIVVHSFDYVGEPYFADIHMYREVRCACSYADSYEEALSEGLRASIKILQDEQKENN